MSFITKSEINLEFLTSLLGSINIQIKIPIIEEIKRAMRIIEIKRLIFTASLFPEDNPMTHVVTDEKIIGIIDIEMKVRNISPKGFEISPKLGNAVITPMASKTERMVMYPLLENFRQVLRMG
jgi:hypothetical protein